MTRGSVSQYNSEDGAFVSEDKKKPGNNVPVQQCMTLLHPFVSSILGKDICWTTDGLRLVVQCHSMTQKVVRL